MKLIFATNNKNKIIEVQALLNNKFNIQSLEEINCFEDIIENKDTIEGNAILKAKYVYDNYKVDCFADDTGLEVESLNGQPGVMSKRFSGADSTSNKNMDKLLKLMEFSENRKAKFKRGIKSLHNIGIKATWRKVFSYLYGIFIRSTTT
jgi:XTP/dITP diphosphohydrolase